MTTAEILNAILDREGGLQTNPANHGNAKGGATKFGITSVTLGEWRHLGRPATRTEVGALTRPEALEILEREYVIGPHFDRIPGDHLRAQLVDFGVNSGPARAMRWLQRAIGVPVTGIVDSPTMVVMLSLPERLVNNALVAARLKMFTDVVDGERSQRQFAAGWTHRALRFFLG